jgi:dimeric dUTPase (all-alpha-NTP-PPase superfamily)
MLIMNDMAASKKPNKKTVKKTELANTEDLPPLSKPQAIDIEHLFAEALLRYKSEQAFDKKHKLKELSHLALIAEEYLSCFALIGYSLQNEKVTIFNMPTAKDEAALVDLLRSTFIDIANNRP